MKYFIANWKARKNLQETELWIHTLLTSLKEQGLTSRLKSDEIGIVICPSDPFLLFAKQELEGVHNIWIGAQDISKFETGSYTGEVTSRMLTSLVDFVLIGHSERRKYFRESDEDLRSKYERAVTQGIQPIYCIHAAGDTFPKGTKYLAYEPDEAIGTGSNLPLADVLRIKSEIAPPKDTRFFYGGSVSPANISGYYRSSEIDGFLVGTASLDPTTFIQLITESV